MDISGAINVPLIGAIDQGTSSTRFILFRSDNFQQVHCVSKPVTTVLPFRDWFEIDAREILQTTIDCIEEACAKVDGADIHAIGLTNQRETIIAWNRDSGEPLYSAIVWCDNRTEVDSKILNIMLSEDTIENIKTKTGLPIHPYFSALKIRWLIENVDAVKSALKAGTCLIGTVDSWLLWNLTGGINGGVHVTDVTNASRTLLMNLTTLQWDKELLNMFDIPEQILPSIRSSSEMYGLVYVRSVNKKIVLCGCLGDQQAALVGQLCHSVGQVKCTYGTGCFLLRNTGTEIVYSKHGLLTTVAYQVGPAAKPCYALEGSIAVAGGLTKWLRDNLALFKDYEDYENLARSTNETGDVYVVPAFSGLYAPYWEPSARGIFCGITQSTTKAHLARACHESVCFLVNDILEAMEADDSRACCNSLRVDGKMVDNNLLLQLQADLASITVVRPLMYEATAVGAALMAAAHIGYYNFDEKRPIFADIQQCDTFVSQITPSERRQRICRWKKAVEKSMDWAETTLPRRKKKSENPNYYYTLAAIGGCTLMLVLYRLFR